MEGLGAPAGWQTNDYGLMFLEDLYNDGTLRKCNANGFLTVSLVEDFTNQPQNEARLSSTSRSNVV